MKVARYRTKKDLKAGIGKPFRGYDPSFFGSGECEGTFCVVGPDANNRKWYAEVTVQNGIVQKVK